MAYLVRIAVYAMKATGLALLYVAGWVASQYGAHPSGTWRYLRGLLLL